ncbi:uroporphyrinogen-III C-methyltransferase [Caldivirga maquilingensis]|uniref:uroporphyrinogen-III C-methyltransferase n=1 Tax=Caldivirga maquilingensis (strain ATCC 700844 / DSM 13496 / JCM 10307 / IC-167) TaxID=397948 RepID=A8M8S1_CALMQ|nr:uroporphyrinogen-III C-methyltransferase [Caldivirga maquilingensis]ABW02140.1 uroporphyrin-III C-methyltransferase [Caldivirga maquilingensis IC-167]
MAKVYIVGAGPGDPELITVKAIKLVESADVIIYDRLIPVDVLKHAKEGAELIYVGKEPGKHTMEQGEINELLLRKALEGKMVVRLHGGDPFVFGRGFEECQYLIKNGVECEAVPGVTSAIAAPEQYLVPILLRGVSSSVALVTGREDPGKGFREVDFKKLATVVGTIVILMGASEACRIAEELIQGGLDSSTPVAVVTRAYMSDSRIQFTTLSEISKCRITVENPSVIIVGKSVKLSPLYEDTVDHSA